MNWRTRWRQPPDVSRRSVRELTHPGSPKSTRVGEPPGLVTRSLSEASAPERSECRTAGCRESVKRAPSLRLRVTSGEARNLKNSFKIFEGVLPDSGITSIAPAGDALSRSGRRGAETSPVLSGVSVMKTKTNVNAVGISINHNQSSAAMKVQTSIKAGPSSQNKKSVILRASVA